MSFSDISKDRIQIETSNALIRNRIKIYTKTLTETVEVSIEDNVYNLPNNIATEFQIANKVLLEKRSPILTSTDRQILNDTSIKSLPTDKGNDTWKPYNITAK